MAISVAIIPARGGSKRIPRKNIKLFCGKPLITWTIEKVLECNVFDRIIVSTDDEEIADIAKKAGAEVPFMRPAALSGDHATTAVVVDHAIEWLINEGKDVDYVCNIYPGSVFIQSAFVNQAFKLVKENEYDSVLSVCEFNYPIQRALVTNPRNTIEFMNPQYALTRTNDLETTYHDAAMFCWVKVQAFRTSKTMITENTSSVVIPRKYVIDIDTPEDFEIAEALFKVHHGIK